MAQYGFIGYGSMGSMLVKELIRSGKIGQNNIIVTRKNLEKLEDIRKDWPDIHLAGDITEVVSNADYIFICVKPMEFYEVLNEMKTIIRPSQHIISIAGSLNIKDIESLVQCKITKILPTLVSEVKEGVTLISHNDMVNESEADSLEKVFQSFARLLRVKEEDFGFASEFTSCGPGLYAAFLQEFVEAGYRHSDSFTKEELITMIAHTVYGTAKLVLENHMDFLDIINRVATKGGITEEGVNVLQNDLPQILDRMFDQTMGKRCEVEEKLHSQYTM